MTADRYIVRGGSWLSDRVYARAEYRHHDFPRYHYFNNGFRVLYGPEPEELSTAWRVVRGGSWIDDPYFAQASVRHSFNPDSRDDYVGFRLVYGP